jgi:hypothetical protein
MLRPRLLLLLFLPALPCLPGCKGSREVRTEQPPPPGNVPEFKIDYTDTDAFDNLLETALVNAEPVIVIRTGRPRPDWEGRLNEWIAAWNMGGTPVPGGTQARGQAPLGPVRVDADSIREFRILVNSLMDRVEDLARERARWWAEEKVRNRRVDLLRPYNLRFHLDEDGNISIILFNGRYAKYHAEFVRQIASPDPENAEDWERRFSCSRCKKWASTLAGRRSEAKETAE